MPTINEPLNTIPIQQFLQRVKAAENSNAKEIKMDMATARSLAYTLGIVMSRLEGDLERFVVLNSQRTDNEKITIQVDGGSSF